MTNPCPRCGTPRLGDYPICQRCGLDFRMAGAPAMPPQQLPPQQPLYGAPQQPLGYLPPAPQQPPAYQQPFGYPAQQSPFGYQQPYPGSSASGQAPTQQSQDFQPAPPPPDTAPSVCLRCYTPLQPGSWHCGSCGFDNRTAWITPNLAVPQRRSMLPIALALLGVALLVAAVALVAIARSST